MLKIYVCGPTVYQDPHIGNLRAVTTYDLVLKALRFLNKPYNFVHNITDIDDKIIKKAIDLNTTEKEISEKYTQKYFELLKTLDIDTITHFEKVTDNIDLISNYVKRLVDSGSAYKDINGNVWFDVKKHAKSYGDVSGQKLDQMEFDEPDQNKHFEADFALWKDTTIGIKYNSHFGLGRPGWHTECCALIDKHFGADGVDLHGGGMDLTFPHHENENIQHVALYNSPLSKKWARCGQINLEGVKMSKSLGNVILPDEFFASHGAEVYKLLLLTAKFTAPINITEELIQSLKSIETKYKKTLFQIYTSFGLEADFETNQSQTIEIMNALADFDFAQYNKLLNEAIKDFNKNKDFKTASVIHTVLNIVHPSLSNKNAFVQGVQLFDEWTRFIEQKDYTNADKIRSILQEKGLY
ncbi:class I tRNA ligase family protein [Mycoplasma simbae]|uniref:class I tRNA ligase family protein n=1 Tax=Mycoplasma simbae TaxID=36744 RepID=UPI0004969588|nr:class I tRNA ligase family protein [Mycoplasma simbae]